MMIFVFLKTENLNLIEKSIYIFSYFKPVIYIIYDDIQMDTIAWIVNLIYSNTNTIY